MKLQDKINDLEKEIIKLKSKVNDLTEHTEEKDTSPSSIVGGSISPADSHPVSFKSGKSAMFGGGVIWNDSDLKIPPGRVEPGVPTKGYNKHTHSRYSGGALIKNGLEIVEYKESSLTNSHNQGYVDLKDDDIGEIENSSGVDVKKIGNLDLVFNPDTQTWRSGGSAEIDVETTYLVKRVTEKDNDAFVEAGKEKQTIGDILKDSKGKEMKSPLLHTAGDIKTLKGRNENLNKSNVYWDENAECWRFYAVFKPAIEEEEKEEEEEPTPPPTP